MPPGVGFQWCRLGIPGHRGTQPKILLPLGQAEAKRIQGSRKLLPPGNPELCRSVPPPPEHPRPCGLGAAVVTAGTDSRAGKLATAGVVVPPAVTLYLGLNREQGPHRINSSH